MTVGQDHLSKSPPLAPTSILSGGVSDKLGNGYEALWTVVEAFRVLMGQADEIRLEPFNEDADGLEFRLTTGGVHAWHQCKRRRTSGSWTMKALDDEGVLQAFARKLANGSDQCVFVSENPAGPLQALVEKARLAQTVKDYEDGLSQADARYREDLRQAWAVGPEIELDWLRRCKVNVTSSESLLREAHIVSALLFKADAATAIDRLFGFLTSKMTHAVTTGVFRQAVRDLGLGWRAWLDETLDAKFAEATDEYLASLSPRIAGETLAVSAVEDAIRLAMGPGAPITVIAGDAGSGKSVSLAGVVASARLAGWPVLALRLDRFLAFQTLEAVGAALVGRDESPVGAFGNRVSDQPSLLLIDQVDAVSESSGRSGRIRDLLFRMLEQSHIYPRMKVVLACRSYDLDRDSRLGKLVSDGLTKSVRLEPLTWDETVAPVLERIGMARRAFSPKERTLLAVPINLQIFVEVALAGEPMEGEISAGRLFDKLIEVRSRNLVEAGVNWTPDAALGALAQYMSETQELTAPPATLSAFPGAPDILSSYGLVSHVGGKLQFAHESFFDHTFSRHFLTTGRTVYDLLVSDEQRLFRRTQVRQIFSRLRDQGASRRYLSNLRDVMDSTEVRYLVKDAVAHWLSEVAKPTLTELNVVQPWHAEGHPQFGLARTIFSGEHWLPLLLSSGTLADWMDAGGATEEFAFFLLRKGAVPHDRLVANYLRTWWDQSQGRTDKLLLWFARLHPDDAIDALEALYANLVGVAPIEVIQRSLNEGTELGAWTHRGKGLGARVLGLWLRRWMELSPQGHPFRESGAGQDTHWLKELAEHQPAALLDAIIPVLAEAIRRERLDLASGALAYPTLRVPYGHHDQRYVGLIEQALAQLARSDPLAVERYLDVLDPTDEPVLYLHLRTVAANGEALHRRLIPLLQASAAFRLGESRREWEPAAAAAAAAFPHLTDADRSVVEGVVRRQKPELSWASTYLKRLKAGETQLRRDDPKGYVIDVLARSGEDERAILTTIGHQQLTAVGRARLDELDRKFGTRPLPDLSSVRGGTVESPIALEVARKMSDRHWIKAIARHSGLRDHSFRRDHIIGGARELGSVLQVLTKDDPDRYATLLESLPADAAAQYAEAVVRGLRDSAAGGETVARAIKAAMRWPIEDAGRMISWTVEKHPEAAMAPLVLDQILRSAEFGEASDTAVRTSGPGSDQPPRSVRERLRGHTDLAASGMNGERGAAFDALANILWAVPETYDPILALLDRRIDAEPLTSVLICMIKTANAVGKYQPRLGIALLRRIAARDIRALLSHAGTHMLRWASYSYPEECEELIEGLATSKVDGQKIFGLFVRSGQALSDDVINARFEAGFAADTVHRQVAAFRGSGNLTSDSHGDRAATWIAPLFDDPEAVVREEMTQTGWAEVLDGTIDRTTLVRNFLHSASFSEHSDGLMRALETRVDRFPDLAFEALNRVLTLYPLWMTDKQRRGHFSTIHHLGRLLVELYRAVEGDPERESDLLDLFDVYLARDLYEMRSEIGRYERH